ncbi:MAG: homoserine kinase [Lentimicrobium sp.]|nr:homoserine kinase [Lentimicrobium sp.]
MPDEITVHSPATIANIVCGFDILGFALENPCDILTIRKTASRGVSILNRDDFGLPTVPENNVIGAALLALLNEVPENIGFEVESTKMIMPGSGIGSSAASAAGSVVAANHLLDLRFTKHDLARFAMVGEAVASGVQHADNIAPGIYGGITLIRSLYPLDIVPVSAPPLYVTVIHPLIEVKTSYARGILKKEIPMADAVTQWGNIAGLVVGLMRGDYDLISRSLVDVVAEPLRSKLIPGFDQLRKKSIEAGALGGGIAGSGPSVFMLSKDEATAKAVESAMSAVYLKTAIDFHTYVTTINNEGVKILNIHPEN